MTREKLLFAFAITFLALSIGALLATRVLRPISSLSKATDALSAGKFSTRVALRGTDELGRLGESFNSMAAQLQEQDAKLRAGREELESRVEQRTEQLIASERRLGVTLNSIGEAVIFTDAEGRVASLNPTAERLTGWPLAEAFNQPLEQVFQIVDQASNARSTGFVARILREGSLTGPSGQTLLTARDGTLKSIAFSAATLMDAESTLGGVVLVFRDETEELKSARALRLGQARFRTLIESGLMGIILGDISGNLHEVNDAFLKIVGYSRADFEAGLLTDQKLNAPENTENQRIAAEQLIATGAPPSPGKKVLFAKMAHGYRC